MSEQNQAPWGPGSGHQPYPGQGYPPAYPQQPPGWTPGPSPQQPYPQGYPPPGYPPQGYPQQAWAPGVQPAPAVVRRQGRAGLVALIAVLVVALGAGVAFGYPLVQGMLSPAKAPAPFKDAPAASYLNGATRSWVLDLKKVFPNQSVRLAFGPDMEGDGNLAHGPVDAGSAWVVRAYAGQDTWLLGIDPETGAVLWKDADHTFFDCASGPVTGVLACGVGRMSRSDHGPRSISLALLNAKTGEVSVKDTFRAENGAFVADHQRIALWAQAPLGSTLYAFDWSGSQLWHSQLPHHDPEDGPPLRLVDGMIGVLGSNMTTFVDAANGSVVATGVGFAAPGPAGTVLASASFKVGTAQPGVRVLFGYGASAKDSRGKWALLRSDSAGTERCDIQAPTSCTRLALGGNVAPTPGSLIEKDGRSYVHLRGASNLSDSLVDIDDGRVLYSRTWSGSPRTALTNSAVGPGPVLVASETTDNVVHLFDAVTGSDVAAATMPGWSPVPDMPGRVLLMRVEDSDANALAAFAPASSKQGIVIPDAATASAAPQVTTTQAAPTASGLPDCESGTTRLASGVLSDGWVLVCGKDPASPTSFRSRTGADEVNTPSVGWEAASNRYLATLSDSSKAWLSVAPAMTGRADAVGHVQLSRAVGEPYFASGASVDSGAFGVPAPQQTAADQVRYLSQILAKSAEARAQLQPAVVAVRECAHASGPGRYSAEIGTIDSVTKNRSDLIDAVQSAPVDQIPDGTALVNQLETSLRDSLAADQQYGVWARGIDKAGCGTGSEDAANAASDKAGIAKNEFVASWNGRIAPAYGVPTIARETL